MERKGLSGFFLGLAVYLFCTCAFANIAEMQAMAYQYLLNPTTCYLLILLALYGLFFELANPGYILPGLIGVIALMLAFYCLELLPINYLGLMLLLLGISFLLLEIYISSFGIAALIGGIMFIAGSIILFDSEEPYGGLSLTLILVMSVITFAFIFLVFTVAMRAEKKSVITGKEGLIGAEGKVIDTNNDQLIVLVNGEIWTAISNVPLKKDDTIIVTNINGLILLVKPKN